MHSARLLVQASDSGLGSCRFWSAADVRYAEVVDRRNSAQVGYYCCAVWGRELLRPAGILPLR